MHGYRPAAHARVSVAIAPRLDTKFRPPNAAPLTARPRAPAPVAPHRSNEGARSLERHRRDVCAESVPDSVLPQVLFDVRQVESVYTFILPADVGANRAQGLRAPEVADDRDDQVPCFERFHEREAFLGREKTPLLPHRVRHGHQVGIGRHRIHPARTSQGIAERRPFLVEGRSVDVLDAVDVLLGQGQPMHAIQVVDDGPEVGSVQIGGRGYVAKRLEQRLRPAWRPTAHRGACARTTATGNLRASATVRTAPCRAGARGGCRGGCRR